MTRTSAPSGPVRTVLVTGAGGFVGSQIALDLARAGFDVVATDQTFDTPTLARLANLHRIEAPLAKALPDIAGLHPHAVVHGAAITAGPVSLGISAAAHLRLNMDMLTLCLDWARSKGASNFVFLSSTGVFAPEDGDHSLTEQSPTSARGPYSAAKKAGEIVTQGAAENGFATLSLRLGNLFGPHEAQRPTRPFVGLLARMVAGALSGVIPVESPGVVRDWTWLPDIGRAIAALLDDFPSGDTPILHCGNTQAISDLDLAKAIAAHFPGARIAVADGSAQSKAPMGRAVTSVLTTFDWTPVPQALAEMLAEKGAA